MPVAARKSRPLYMAVDFGTSHIRASVGHATGKPLSTVRVPVKYEQPSGGPDTAVEFSPAEAWAAVGTASKGALREAAVSAEDIRAVAVTSQRLGLVMYD